MSTSEKTEKAVLFTDIVGSTPLKPLAGGDTAYFLRILYPHHTKLRQALSSYGGDEIKTTGDGFLILFDDVASAVGYALKAQEYFSTEDFDLDLSVRIRIGIHFGSVLLYEDRPSKDVTGSAVDFAARVCALGNDGQILLSKDASAKLPPEGFHLREWTGYTLKGFQGIHSVFEVQWGPNYRSREPEGGYRLCESLRILVKPLIGTKGGPTQPRSISLNLRSLKQGKVWSYEITSTACCGELADALAEQHFSPFHKSFKWFVFDEGGTEFPREKTLDECGVREGAVLILRMVCSAPPLDPARLREPNALFYANHELECTADFSDAIRKMEKIVQTERWNTEVLNNLACVYLEANQNISRAKELVGLYLGSEPDAKDAAWFQDTIGWLEYRNGNWLKAEDFLRKSLRGTNRWEDREGYNETLYHLYFAWRRLKKDTAAGFARDELLAWLSTYGRPQLFAKRIELDDDSYLLPTDSYLGERRLHALGISRHGQWELISAA